MNPVTSALARPVTVLVLAVGVLLAGGLAASRMKADVFPALNLPVIYVAQPYGGMDPQQMEGLIANYYEYHFLYVNGIHHVESKSVQGMTLMKLYFHPGTDMAQAMGETVGYVNRSRAFMPPGTVNPFIMRYDTGSVPVGCLVLASDDPERTLGEIQDKALFRVRPMFAAIEGVSAPPPFGGSQRTVVVRIDPERLKAYDLSADDVTKKLSEGNTIAPSGQLRDATRMPLVPSNAMVVKPDELGSIEVKPGVFLRHVVKRDKLTDRPLIDDASDTPSGYALVNGRRAVYILVTKRANASTLDVVANVRANLPKMQAELPDDIRVSFELDQSPYVTHALTGVAVEGLLAAGLVGLMVLVFLRDWRAVLVVVLNIPFALVAAVVALWLSGQTINVMTLGGLALAVGILVDESTVAVENVHVQLEKTQSVALAAWRGVTETAVPRLLALLCILAVFLPAFVMEGVARGLFLPLALAVGFAMTASYVLSGTLVPVLCVWLLRARKVEHAPRATHSAFGQLVEFCVRVRWVLVPAYLALAGLVVGVGGPRTGTDIFPKVDAGSFQLRLRAPTGTRIEETEAITQEALRVVAAEVKELGGEVEISLGYVGVVASSYPINAIYLWSGGPHEAAVRVKLKPGGVRVDDLTARLRKTLPAHLKAWTATRWSAPPFNLPAAVAERRANELRLSFEPADIMNEVTSFGSPTPVEVQIAGANLTASRQHADKIAAELHKAAGVRDVQYAQPLDYPTAEVLVDREKLAASGVTASDVARAVTPFTSSSRFTVPNYWRDPASGVGYQVQVEVPFALVNSPADLEQVPVADRPGGAVLLREVGTVREGTMPGEIDRYNMKRVVSLTGTVQGADLGTVADQVDAAVRAAGEPPKGVTVDVRGQITPYRQLFRGLLFGLGLAVASVLLLLTAYFQSPRLALAAVVPVPAALAGALLALLLTGSTLNLQSFLGAITAVGVATANAILFVTFAERSRRGGMTASEAAVEGARGRVRPILMTSCAMLAGMLPMALGLGDGGDQTAPLGRAVVGGLLAATLASLFVLPAAFALLMRGPARSPSLSPFDPAGRHHTPEPPHAP